MQSGAESIFTNGIPEEEEIDTRNLESWLLQFSPVELTVLANLFAIYVTLKLTIQEQAVVASFISAISSSIIVISTQQVLINRAEDIERQIVEREQRIKQKEQELIEKEQEMMRQLQKDIQIHEMNQKIEKLEALLNSHLENTLN